MDITEPRFARGVLLQGMEYHKPSKEFNYFSKFLPCSASHYGCFRRQAKARFLKSKWLRVKTLSSWRTSQESMLLVGMFTHPCFKIFDPAPYSNLMDIIPIIV